MTRISFTHDRDGDKIATAKCLDCQEHLELHSRGLCGACYQRNRRQGTLEEYPTTLFLNSPEEYIQWAVRFYPELVQHYIAEQGGS